MTRTCECGCGLVPNLAPQSSTYRGWVKGEPVRFVKGHHYRSMKTNRKCDFAGCEKRHKANGLCGTHLSQKDRGKELTPIGQVGFGPKPKINECGHPDRKHYGHGKCRPCWLDATGAHRETKRRKLGWYAEGGMATDEELAQFTNHLRRR